MELLTSFEMNNIYNNPQQELRQGHGKRRDVLMHQKQKSQEHHQQKVADEKDDDDDGHSSQVSLLLLRAIETKDIERVREVLQKLYILPLRKREKDIKNEGDRNGDKGESAEEEEEEQEDTVQQTYQHLPERARNDSAVGTANLSRALFRACQLLLFDSSSSSSSLKLDLLPQNRIECGDRDNDHQENMKSENDRDTDVNNYNNSHKGDLGASSSSFASSSDFSINLIQIVKLLLDSGARIDASVISRISNRSGESEDDDSNDDDEYDDFNKSTNMNTDKVIMTPLHLVCQAGNLQIVQLLLDYTRQNNNKDMGQTKVHISTDGNENGISDEPNSLNSQKQEQEQGQRLQHMNMALYYGCQSGNLKLVQFLMTRIRQDYLMPNVYDDTEDDHQATGEMDSIDNKEDELYRRAGDETKKEERKTKIGPEGTATLPLSTKTIVSNAVVATKDMLEVALENKYWDIIQYLLEQGIQPLDKPSRTSTFQSSSSSPLPSSMPTSLSSLPRFDRSSSNNKSANFNKQYSTRRLLLGASGEGNNIQVVNILLRRHGQQHHDDKNEEQQEQQQQIRQLQNEKDGEEASSLRPLFSSPTPPSSTWIPSLELLRTKDEDGNTPLHFACKYGNLEVAKFLLDWASSSSSSSSSNLFFSSSVPTMGSSSSSQMAFSSSSSFRYMPHPCRVLLDTSNDDKKTPLHIACENNHIGIVELLLESGADIEAQDNMEQTALHLACQLETDVIGRLLLSSSSLSSTTTATTTASTTGAADDSTGGSMSINNDITRALVQYVDERKRTALHLACENYFATVALVQQLIECGSYVDAVDKDEMTPLLYACKGDNLEVVELLVFRHDAKVETSDGYEENDEETNDYQRYHHHHHHRPRYYRNNGNTSPLHFACQNDNLDLVRLLLSRKVNVYSKSRDHRYETPLHVACRTLCSKPSTATSPSASMPPSLEIIKLLLQRGGTRLVNATNEQQQTPLHIVTSHGSVVTPSSYLNDAVDLLLKTGARLDTADDNDEIPLHYAVRNCDMRVVQKLLFYDNDSDEASFGRFIKNIDAVNHRGRTPLHVSCSYLARQRKSTRQKSYRKIHAQNNDENTSTNASIAITKEIVQLLLTQGANVNAEDDEESTPLHLLCQRGGGRRNKRRTSSHKKYDDDYDDDDDDDINDVEGAEIVSILLQGGADMFAVNYKNESVFHLACQFSDSNMIRELLRYNPSLLDAIGTKTRRNTNSKTPWQLAPEAIKRDILDFMQTQTQENSVPNGGTIKFLQSLSENKDVLFYLVQHDTYEDLFQRLVQQNPGILYCRDSKHRTLLEMSCDACRRATLFLGRYKIDSSNCKYKSDSCQVYFAEDWGVRNAAAKKMLHKRGSHNAEDGDENEDDIGSADEHKNKIVPVALKFFEDKTHFEAERAARRYRETDEERFDTTYILADLHWYDGEEDQSFALECQKWQKPIRCVVLEQGERNLYEAIGAENLLGNKNQLRGVLHELAESIDHVHQEGFIHGDIKPRNVVRRLNDKRWQLVDMDSCTEIDRPVAGLKLSTAYAPPEVVTIVAGRPFLRALCTADLSASTQEKEKKVLIAHPSYDIWSFGMLMYELVMGISFFRSNINDNLEGEAKLKKLARWRDADSKKKLDKVADPVAKKLLQRLLRVDPTQRPSMEDVLEDDFFHPDRIQNQIGGLNGRLDLAKSQGNMEEIAKLTWEIQTLKTQVEEQTDLLNQVQVEVVKTRYSVENRLDEISDSISRLEMTSRATNALVAQLVKGDKPVPRYFSIIPAETTLWDYPTRWISTRAKVVFLCPISYRIMHEFGYEMNIPADWVKRYGPALVASLHCLRLALVAGRIATGLPIPGIDNLEDWFSNLCGGYVDANSNNNNNANKNSNKYENDDIELEEVLGGLSDSCDVLLDQTEEIVDYSARLEDISNRKWLTTVKDSFAELIEKVASSNDNDDDEYEQSGLVKAISPDGTVEFVHPDYVAVYESHGSECQDWSPSKLEMERNRLAEAAMEGESRQYGHGQSLSEHINRRQRFSDNLHRDISECVETNNSRDVNSAIDQNRIPNDGTGRETDGNNHSDDNGNNGKWILDILVEKQQRRFPFKWSKYTMKLQRDGILYYAKGDNDPTDREGKVLRILDLEKIADDDRTMIQFISSSKKKSFRARPIIVDKDEEDQTQHGEKIVDKWVHEWSCRLFNDDDRNENTPTAASRISRSTEAAPVHGAEVPPARGAEAASSSSLPAPPNLLPSSSGANSGLSLQHSPESDAAGALNYRSLRVVSEGLRPPPLPRGSIVRE